MAALPTPSPAPRPRVHEHRIRVRYGETDQMGVVHHSNHALYLEEARTAFLADLGWSYGGLERSGVGLAVRRLELRFRAPARYEDELRVRTRIAKVGGASVTFEYEIDALPPASGAPLRVAEASTELACIDLTGTSRRPRLLPDGLRELLEELRPR